MLSWLFKPKQSFKGLKIRMPREELVRRSRILIIDDERPDLVDDLSAAHFSVDHVDDITPENMGTIERPLYDLVLLDFGGVGTQFGNDHGLSLLKHLKRVNPAIVVLTYTSKALETKHADFYRLADGVLAKDAGIQESLERIEDGLRKAHSLDNVWNGLLSITGVEAGSSKDTELQALYVEGLTNPRKLTQLKESVLNLTAEGSKVVASTLLGKLVELGVQAALGG